MNPALSWLIVGAFLASLPWLAKKGRIRLDASLQLHRERALGYADLFDVFPDDPTGVPGPECGCLACQCIHGGNR